MSIVHISRNPSPLRPQKIKKKVGSGSAKSYFTQLPLPYEQRILFLLNPRHDFDRDKFGEDMLCPQYAAQPPVLGICMSIIGQKLEKLCKNISL